MAAELPDIVASTSCKITRSGVCSLSPCYTGYVAGTGVVFRRYEFADRFWRSYWENYEPLFFC